MLRSSRSILCLLFLLHIRVTLLQRFFSFRTIISIWMLITASSTPWMQWLPRSLQMTDPFNG